MAQVEGLNLKMPGDLGSELALSRGPVMDPFATDFDGTDDRVTTAYKTRRNFVRNPRCLNDLTAITGDSGPSVNLNGGATHGRFTSGGPSDPFYPYVGVQTTSASAYQGVSFLLANPVYWAGVTYRARAYVATGGTSIEMLLGGTHTDNGAPVSLSNSGWQLFECTWTPSANRTASDNYALTIRTSSAVARNFFVTACIVEAAPSVGTFFDGSAIDQNIGGVWNPSGHVGWSGAVGNSASESGAFAAGTNRTYMVWAARDSTANEDCMIGGDWGNCPIFRFAAGSRNVDWFPASLASVTWANAQPNDTNWHHYAITYVDSTRAASLYVDGVLVSTQTVAAGFEQHDVPQNLTVGIRGGVADLYDGKMAWVSVHEKALTASQIASAASATDYETVIRSFGSVGIILPLNSKGGLTDASGNGRNGTAVGGVTVGAYSPGPLDTGTKWALYELDLGNPSKREEMISSTDSDGSVPARVQKLENREVTFSVQLGDASSQDDAVAKIGALEAYLQKAEEVASQTVIDPANHVRLVYTPADSTQSFFLPIMSAEITSVPKTVEDGWFVNFPKVSVRCVCDPAGYGALRTYLDSTTSAAPAPSVTVAGGPGDLPPWIRTAVKDVAATARGLVRLSVKRGESSTTATVLASAMTPVAGTYSAPNMTTSSTSTDWSVLATTPRQTRQGTFKVYAHRVSQPGGGTPSLRLTWGEAGGSVRHNATVTGIDASLRDVYLGEVTANASWDMWLESKGGVSLYSLILIPSDSFVEVTTALPGEQMVGAVAIADPLQTTSTHIGGRTIPTGGGTWTTTNSSSPTWPVSAANWARRTATGMGTSPAFAQAGTTNYMDVQVKASTNTEFTFTPSGLDATLPRAGVFARWVNSTNYIVAGGLSGETAWEPTLTPAVVAVVGGTPYRLTSNARGFGDGGQLDITLQVVSDGRWFFRCRWVDSGTGVVIDSVSESGQSPLLVSGSTLGDSSNAKVGIFDFQDNATITNRNTKDFSAAPLAGVTPAPIPSGSTIRLAGPDMYGTDSQDYPYIGSSGLTLSPGVNNNLTVMAQRSAVGHASTSTADTPALDIDIDGYPRYLSVPHA